jgi:hypothetical protein
LNPIHNIDLILIGLQKCLDYNRKKEAFEIACYCIPFFEKNSENMLVYSFLQQHIILDYYYNNESLFPQILFLINEKTLKNDPYISILLENNRSNIDFYRNKALIL